MENQEKKQEAVALPGEVRTNAPPPNKPRKICKELRTANASASSEPR